MASTCSSHSVAREHILQTPSSRLKPTVFVISPPPASAMARVKQRYKKENRNPANRATKRSPNKVKRNFKFDYDPVNYDESLPITESLKGLDLSLDIEDSDFLDNLDHPVRKTVAELIKRICHLNQLVQECMHENSSLKNAVAVHTGNEMSLQVEIEHMSQTIHTLKDRLGAMEKEQKLTEKKAKLNYASLEKKFNAIRFRDKQYNNELRKRELECEKVQKKLRLIMASSRTGTDNPSLKSSIQKLPTMKSSSSDFQKEVVLLREDNQRMDTKWNAVCDENLRMRNLFMLIVNTMQSTVSTDCASPPNSPVLDLPIEVAGDQLEATVAGLVEKIRESLQIQTSQRITDEYPIDDPMAAISDLKHIIKKQEELIRRAIFKEHEVSPKCNRCDKSCLAQPSSNSK